MKTSYKAFSFIDKMFDKYTREIKTSQCQKEDYTSFYFLQSHVAFHIATTGEIK